MWLSGGSGCLSTMGAGAGSVVSPTPSSPNPRGCPLPLNPGRGDSPGRSDRRVDLRTMEDEVVVTPFRNVLALSE